MRGRSRQRRLGDTKVVRINADPTLVQAARGFLESWLIRKDYDAAFAFLSPKSYACYDLESRADEAPSSSPEEAGRKLRAGLETVGKALGNSRSLEAILAPAEPRHPAIRVMNHQVLARLQRQQPSECHRGRIGMRRAHQRHPPARADTARIREWLQHEHAIQDPQRGRAGAAALVAQRNGAWLITSYAVELP